MVYLPTFSLILMGSMYIGKYAIGPMDPSIFHPPLPRCRKSPDVQSN